MWEPPFRSRAGNVFGGVLVGEDTAMENPQGKRRLGFAAALRSRCDKLRRSAAIAGLTGGNSAPPWFCLTQP